MSTEHDHLDARTAGAVAAFLDLEPEDFVDGRPLPLMWHLFYFLKYPAQNQIGPDGHPTVGSPTPPGKRRMFAGGRVVLAPGLLIGDRPSATTEKVSEKHRSGRTGELTFVTTRSTFSVDGRPGTLVDERDIVYLPLAPTSGSAPAAPKSQATLPVPEQPDAAAGGTVSRQIDVTPTLLFRFSALTYNAHRIHYDGEYTRNVEGYPGLVVHGPLQALLMAQLASEVHGAIRGTDVVRFSYKLVSPLFENDGLIVSAVRTENIIETRVSGSDGRTTATGTLQVGANAPDGDLG